MANRKATIHDIAAQLGMSASTVSRALSDNNRISAKTKERVKTIASELNYKPNHLASSFRKGKSKTIGIIIPRINRHFFSHAISGMESVTNPAGYNLMICQSNESFEEEMKSVQTFINNRVDGIIMSVSVNSKNSKHVKAAIAEGIQVVQFDRVNPDLDIDKVLNDNFAGGYEVTNHLISQGYKRILHCAGPLQNNVYNDRCEGYKKAMAEAGLEIADDMIVEMGLTRAEGANLAAKLVVDERVPEAIFASSDYIALGAFLEFKKHNYHIPNDIAIAGFANEPFTEFIEPGITTLEQHGIEMGRTAAKLLIERLEGDREIMVARTVTIKPELQIRKSTLK